MVVTGAASVSYTHLDVYKRQLYDLRIYERSQKGMGDHGNTGSLQRTGKQGTVPVSYTHLDVYKRQSKSCAHHGKWECNVGSGIAECADRISDKKLVCNVVYRTDKHGDNARYGKAQNQRRNFVHGKWILLF